MSSRTLKARQLSAGRPSLLGRSLRCGSSTAVPPGEQGEEAGYGTVEGDGRKRTPEEGHEEEDKQEEGKQEEGLMRNTDTVPANKPFAGFSYAS